VKRFPQSGAQNRNDIHLLILGFSQNLSHFFFPDHLKAIIQGTGIPHPCNDGNKSLIPFEEMVSNSSQDHNYLSVASKIRLDRSQFLFF
jgi:hypothetical protein